MLRSKEKEIWQNIFAAGLVIFLSAVLFGFKYTYYFNIQKDYDGRTSYEIMTVSDNGAKTQSGYFLYTLKMSDNPFKIKLITYSRLKCGIGDEISGSFSFKSPSDEYLNQNMADNVILTAFIDDRTEIEINQHKSIGFYIRCV